MTKLNQVIAVEKRVKSDALATLTKAYHDAQKTGPMSGIARTYRPKDDDGDQFPPESTKVQLRVQDMLAEVSKALTRLYDLTLTKDSANQSAVADIKVGDLVIAEKVPVTTLLFLEKQLQDVLTFVSKLPVLDPSETWTYNPGTDSYATEPAQTVKTKKIPRNHVLAEATEKHPAQVQVFTEDVVIGQWTTIKYSGAMDQEWVNATRAKVVKLIEAVQKAREEANGIQVTDRKMGEAIFGYLFGG